GPAQRSVCRGERSCESMRSGVPIHMSRHTVLLHLVSSPELLGIGPDAPTISGLAGMLRGAHRGLTDTGHPICRCCRWSAERRGPFGQKAGARLPEMAIDYDESRLSREPQTFVRPDRPIGQGALPLAPG